MSFLHPWAIALGAAALVLPVVIHFLTRPRPHAMPLSTIRFVQEAVKQRRAVNRIRDWLVLLLRALAIGLIAWAFAQPRLLDSPVESIDPDTQIRRVVVLDASQSMSASDSGVDGFQAARVQASRFLKADSKVRANLIVAAANPVAVFDSPSSNARVLAESLASVDALPQRIDVQAAINSAAEMLSAGQPEIRRELVVISDFQRNNWATIDFSPLPVDTLIRLESTAPAETRDNIAIVQVGFSEKPTAGTRATFEVVVENFSQDTRTVRVQVAMAENVFVIEQICPRNVRTVLTKEILVGESGWQTGIAVLLENEDAMIADDRFPFVVQTMDRPACTIVTRQPPSLRPSSSYFLERGLAPSERSVGQMVVTRISPGRFGVDEVAGSQLLVFDHPGRMERAQIRSLASLIRRGRGVLYVASERVDATNLKMLYDELGSDLRAPVEMVPVPRGEQRRSLSINLNSVQRDARPFSVFADSISATLGNLRFSGGLATRTVPDALEDEVLARLSDQSALMFLTPVGMGNLAVLNADLGESNLPRQPAFVPLLNELVDALLQSNRRTQSAYCGEPLTRILPAAITSGEGLVVEMVHSVQAEDAPDDRGTFRQSGDGISWSWRRPTGPAVFQLQQNGDMVYSLAVRVPPEESDLRTLDADVLTERLSGGRTVDFHRVSEQGVENDTSWIWFAVAAMMALIGEVFVLRIFKT